MAFNYYRYIENGVGGGPIRVPKIIRGNPARWVPFNYYTICIDSSDFLLGVFAGLYIGIRNGYIQRDLDLKIANHIYFDQSGLEIGGTYDDWVKMDRHKYWLMFRRTIPYAIGGGFAHCISCYFYRIFGLGDGHMLPMLCTYFQLSIRDDAFLDNYRTMGKIVYISCLYEMLHFILFKGNLTFWVFHLTSKFVLRPFELVSWPPTWVGRFTSIFD